MIEKICKSCNHRLSEYYQTGMLGCPDCYRAFRAEIESTLSNFQGGRFHVGKIPTVSNSERELLQTYHDLIKQKEIAGISGNFKQMAMLTKSIQALSEELKERGLL